MKILIIIAIIASTFSQVGHYIQTAQQAQQLCGTVEVDPDEVIDPDELVVVSPVVEEDEYQEMIGDWDITMAYLDGEVQYFDEDSGFNERLCFYSDRTVELFEFTDGVQTLAYRMDVEYDDIYYTFIYDDTDVLPSTIAYEVYTVLSVYDDEMTVALMFYDEDDCYLGSYTLYFEKTN
jgi:hypothetical protein